MTSKSASLTDARAVSYLSVHAYARSGVYGYWVIIVLSDDRMHSGKPSAADAGRYWQMRVSTGRKNAYGMTPPAKWGGAVAAESGKVWSIKKAAGVRSFFI